MSIQCVEYAFRVIYLLLVASLSLVNDVAICRVGNVTEHGISHQDFVDI